MRVPRSHLKISRVLSEDNDFMVVEIGKRDDVTYHLQMDDEGETVGGDKFLSLVFVKANPLTPGQMVSWDPHG